MQITDRIEAFELLGNILSNFVEAFDSEQNCDEDLKLAVHKTYQENPWFTSSNQLFAITEWATALQTNNLQQWISNYNIDSKSNKSVGIICAGNIPLVGFHDILSVLIYGLKAKIKLSSKDKHLIPAILNKLIAVQPDFKNQIEIVDKLIDYDAVIATGSNNTARYFESYFKNVPSIIRKNRTSIAVLSGVEQTMELENLGEDIFRYFGMGCRNVTQLFVPKNYDLDKLFQAFYKYKEIVYHNKYGNNYDYHKAIFLMNKDVFFDNGFILLKESDALFSPLATLNFTTYNTIEDVNRFKEIHKEKIQCSVGFQQALDFGEAQHPKLWDYADNIDTLDFLKSI